MKGKHKYRGLDVMAQEAPPVLSSHVRAGAGSLAAPLTYPPSRSQYRAESDLLSIALESGKLKEAVSRIYIHML